MLKVLAVLSLAAVCLGSPLGAFSGEAKLSPPIVGGENADIKDYPYQAALTTSNSLCGAVIISNTKAFTAAHCTRGVSASQLTIRVGSNYYNKGGTTYKVSAKHEHPNYKPSTFDYDYSILDIDGTIEFGPNVAAVPLIAEGVELPAGTPAIISGFGTTSSGGPLPAQLQAVEIPLVSAAECKAAYGSSSITDRMICAGVPEGGKDSCQGDSGGPLVVNGKLAGLVSWGDECAKKDYPGVYSNIADQRSWIDGITGL